MAEINEHVAGNCCWLDLGTPDADASKAFYSGLFGWTAVDMPTGDHGVYTMLRLKERDVCALYQMNPEQKAQGVPAYWMPYFSTPDVAESTKKVQHAGGTVVMPPMQVMDAGHMALFQDPTGAMFALWQANKHTGFGLFGEPGALCWSELVTSNVDQAGHFYGHVFGWNPEAMPMPGMTYTIFKNGAGQAGGMMPLDPSWKGVPSHWLSYFVVENCDETVRLAKELGAQVCADSMDIPNVGRMAPLRDPQGGAFCIIQPAS